MIGGKGERKEFGLATAMSSTQILSVPSAMTGIIVGVVVVAVVVVAVAVVVVVVVVIGAVVVDSFTSNVSPPDLGKKQRVNHSRKRLKMIRY